MEFSDWLSLPSTLPTPGKPVECKLTIDHGGPLLLDSGAPKLFELTKAKRLKLSEPLSCNSASLKPIKSPDLVDEDPDHLAVSLSSFSGHHCSQDLDPHCCTSNTRDPLIRVMLDAAVQCALLAGMIGFIGPFDQEKYINNNQIAKRNYAVISKDRPQSRFAPPATPEMENCSREPNQARFFLEDWKIPPLIWELEMPTLALLARAEMRGFVLGKEIRRLVPPEDDGGFLSISCLLALLEDSCWRCFRGNLLRFR
ncbi:unnamed protein product [Protopolystoma xenopodis]|uniref:Uncharacterized protein n=1 Tax=Protopolystoma xenopodis TaxID=117903 RepID=A0A3S5AMP7_9PLAT|nr:unnamed protein product [Protopolystoma xenopodis]